VLEQLGVALMYVNKREAEMQFGNCATCSTCCCFVHYFNWKFEALFFCSSTEAGIIFNLFLNFDQKW